MGGLLWGFMMPKMQYEQYAALDSGVHKIRAHWGGGVKELSIPLINRLHTTLSLWKREKKRDGKLKKGKWILEGSKIIIAPPPSLPSRSLPGALKYEPVFIYLYQETTNGYLYEIGSVQTWGNKRLEELASLTSFILFHIFSWL